MLEEVNKISSYPEVNAILHRLKLDVQTVLREQFIGMYVHGSLALGDFNPESSDIDFLVTTASELSKETIDELKNMHDCIIVSDLKWSKKLEGSYIPQYILRQQNPPETPRPYINGEKFYTSTYGYEWILERYILWKNGIVIAGPPIESMIDFIHSDDLRMAALAIFSEWWLPMLDDRTRLKSDEYQVYTILTICRILYTLNFGTVVSKPVAAAWAKRTLNGKWTQFIEQALSWREDKSLNLLDEALDFIRFTQEYSGRFLGLREKY